jgi:hypothetical protein
LLCIALYFPCLCVPCFLNVACLVPAMCLSLFLCDTSESVLTYLVS